MSSRPRSVRHLVRFGFLLGFFLAGDACLSPSEPGTPGISVISKSFLTDTINARLSEPIVVEARDANGVIASGVSVSFAIVYSSQPAVQGLALSPSGPFEKVMTAVSDRFGRARVYVRLGDAGDGTITVEDASTGSQRTVAVTTSPGNSVRLILKGRDTAAMLGSEYLIDAAVVDRLDNPRQNLVQITADGPATVSGLRLIGTDFGQVTITATSLGYRETATVQIVPPGLLAAFYQPHQTGQEGGIIMFRTDGSGAKVLYRKLFRNLRPTPFGTWPVWHPSGDRLAFVDSQQLRVVDTMGRVSTIVDGDVAGGTQPQYSADGQWIYFMRNYGIWRVSASGGIPEQVSPVPQISNDDWPSPHPDGQLIAYHSSLNPADSEDHTVRIQGIADGVLRETTVPGASPRWSPSGDRLAFRARDDRAYLSGIVRTMRPDGSDNRPIPSLYDMQYGFSWSPDSKWIVGVGLTGLSIYSVESELVMPLSFRGPSGRELYQPSWSPR